MRLPVYRLVPALQNDTGGVEMDINAMSPAQEVMGGG